MAGATREAGTVHSFGTPGCTPYANALSYKRFTYYDNFTIGRASLAFVLRDVTRFTALSPRLVQLELSLVFDPMLSLWGF